MTDKRISDLEALTGADATDNDLIEIVDVSDTTGDNAGPAGENKKITRGEFFKNVNITSGSVSGITDLAITDGGTGASDAAGARSNLNVYSQTEVDTLVNATAANVGKRARVRAATTAALTIATGLNVGDTVDGVTLADGDLVLVKDQAAPAENGVYVAGTTPARFVEFNTYDEHPGSLVAAQDGTTNANTLWLCTSNTGGTLGTTAIAFTKLVVAGELLKDNNLNDVQSAATSRTNLGLGPTTLAAQEANNVSITGGSITGITDLAVADGGTGASSLTANGVLYGAGTSAIGATAVGTAGQALLSGGTGVAPAYGAVADVQYFATAGANQVWTKPANAKAVFVLLMAGGGAGGAGEKNVANAAAGGGGGGASGGISAAWFDAAQLGLGGGSATVGTELVTVGAGGTAPGTRNTTGAGTKGPDGGNSTFTISGTVALFAGGGLGGYGGGSGGTGYGGGGGQPAAYNATANGTYGGDGSSGVLNTGASGGGGTVIGVAGAGAGGGGNYWSGTANTKTAGGAGGNGSIGTGPTGVGAAGGAAGTNAGGVAGTTAGTNRTWGGGGGGGGDGRQTAGNGYNGGAGAIPGGGGGGGGNGMGASGTNTNGNGGAGARGFALVITYR